MLVVGNSIRKVTATPPPYMAWHQGEGRTSAKERGLRTHTWEHKGTIDLQEAPLGVASTVPSEPRASVSSSAVRVL